MKLIKSELTKEMRGVDIEFDLESESDLENVNEILSFAFPSSVDKVLTEPFLTFKSFHTTCYHVGLRLYWRKSESDIGCRWVRLPNLLAFAQCK